MTTCDDLRVPKPATGKTPVRNVRIPDEIWLPALAKAEVAGLTATDAVEAGLILFTAEPSPQAYEFTFANWPGGAAWADSHGGALAGLASDLGEAGITFPHQWLDIAAWLATTHHQGDPVQQRRVITGHVLRRLTAELDHPWRGRYRDSRHLSETVQAILERHLPLGED